jgi:UDP-N-acetylmuramoylalanine--D-glutamate ligase
MFSFFKKKPAKPKPAEATASQAETVPPSVEQLGNDTPKTSEFELAGANVTVLGLGKSGISAARLLSREGARVTVIDDNADAATDGLPPGITTCFGGAESAVTAALEGADLIVLSPGVPNTQPRLNAARDKGVPVIAEVELAWQNLPNNTPLIAITGTNGKSTVTAWVGHVLAGWKPRIFAGGNLGEPLSEAALSDTDWDVVVAELSSFQLETITSFTPTVAALLNTSPDHMDRYGNVSEYYRAKFRIFEFMEHGYALLNEADPSTSIVTGHHLHGAAPVLFGRKKSDDGIAGDGVSIQDGAIALTQGGQTHAICPVDAIRLTGSHNLENAQAVAAICLLIGCPLPTVAEGLKSFTGLPHRMEVIATKNGITYINDSKATNPGAVIKAIIGAAGASGTQDGGVNDIPEDNLTPVTLLVGGRDKGSDLFSLRQNIFQFATHVIAFGEAAERFRIVLQGHPSVSYVDSMEEALALAVDKTESGVVLLSPACASFDEFNSFGDRGDAFRRQVEAL